MGAAISGGDLVPVIGGSFWMTPDEANLPRNGGDGHASMIRGHLNRVPVGSVETASL